MSRLTYRVITLLCAIALQASPGVAQTISPRGAVPVFSPTGFDAEFYGAKLGYPAGLPLTRQDTMVGAYSRYDTLFPTHRAAAAAQPFALKRAALEISANYTYWGVTYSIAGYLVRNPTTGLLIARGDTILFEHYQYGRTDSDRFLSQSMAKTVVSMLVGIAVAEGAIRSIDDPAQIYVPELANTELGRTPIRAFLHMASGIAFEEDYSGRDDNAKLGRALFARTGPGPIAAVSQFNTRIAPPDMHWNYAGLNTEVLGLVLARATKMSLTQYLQTRIWQPMGAEADATWTIDNSGQEIAYCCFNATLRDYARFGLLLANDGALNGRQIIPRQWVLEATAPVAQGSFLALDGSEHPPGYGYQIWLMPGPRRTFYLDGHAGQRIFIDPASKLVLVHTAVRRNGDPRGATLVALWESLLAQVGQN